MRRGDFTEHIKEEASQRRNILKRADLPDLRRVSFDPEPRD